MCEHTKILKSIDVCKNQNSNLSDKRLLSLVQAHVQIQHQFLETSQRKKLCSLFSKLNSLLQMGNLNYSHTARLFSLDRCSVYWDCSDRFSKTPAVTQTKCHPTSVPPSTDSSHFRCSLWLRSEKHRWLIWDLRLAANITDDLISNRVSSLVHRAPRTP